MHERLSSLSWWDVPNLVAGLLLVQFEYLFDCYGMQINWNKVCETLT